MTSRRHYWVVIQLCIVFCSSNVNAGSSDTEETGPDYKWFLSLYGGQHTKNDLDDMVTLEADYGGNYLAVLALAREIYRYKQ
jgi:hypothetical protein